MTVYFTTNTNAPCCDEDGVLEGDDGDGEEEILYDVRNINFDFFFIRLKYECLGFYCLKVRERQRETE